MNSLHGIIVIRIFREAGKTLIWHKLNWNLLRCTTVESDENMCEAETGLFGHIYKSCENIKYLKPVAICCLINQQLICCRHLNLSCVFFIKFVEVTLVSKIV